MDLYQTGQAKEILSLALDGGIPLIEEALGLVGRVSLSFSAGGATAEALGGVRGTLQQDLEAVEFFSSIIEEVGLSEGGALAGVLGTGIEMRLGFPPVQRLPGTSFAGLCFLLAVSSRFNDLHLTPGSSVCWMLDDPARVSINVFLGMGGQLPFPEELLRAMRIDASVGVQLTERHDFLLAPNLTTLVAYLGYDRGRTAESALLADREIRQAALDACELEGLAVLDELLDACTNPSRWSESWEFRANSILALGTVAGMHAPGASQPRVVIEAAVHDPEPGVRLRAAFGIAKYPAATSVPTLRRLCTDTDPDVARTAQRLLARG